MIMAPVTWDVLHPKGRVQVPPAFLLPLGGSTRHLGIIFAGQKYYSVFQWHERIIQAYEKWDWGDTAYKSKAKSEQTTSLMCNQHSESPENIHSWDQSSPIIPQPHVACVCTSEGQCLICNYLSYRVFICISRKHCSVWRKMSLWQTPQGWKERSNPILSGCKSSRVLALVGLVKWKILSSLWDGYRHVKHEELAHLGHWVSGKTVFSISKM